MQGANTINIGIPSIDTLHKEKVIKDNSKIEIFKTVLNKCVEKIIYTNRHTDKTFVIFEVPKILIGYPSYDMKMCILFLINQLSKKKYYVTFIEPFYLYIDWGTVGENSNKELQITGNIRTNNPQKLKQHTRDLLQKFPDTTKVEFVYEDMVGKGNSSKLKNKKKR